MYGVLPKNVNWGDSAYQIERSPGLPYGSSGFGWKLMAKSRGSGSTQRRPSALRCAARICSTPYRSGSRHASHGTPPGPAASDGFSASFAWVEIRHGPDTYPFARTGAQPGDLD